MSNTPDDTGNTARSTELAAEKYVSLTTFTKDGRPKPTPVWIVGLPGGELAFNTEADSWKVKRITNTPKVSLRPCDMRGRVADGAPVVEATAIASAERHAEVAELLKAKYGFMFHVGMARAKVMGMFSKTSQGDAVSVIITLD